MFIPFYNTTENRQMTNIAREILKSSACDNVGKQSDSNRVNKTNYACISLISRIKMRKYRISCRLFFGN